MLFLPESVLAQETWGERESETDRYRIPGWSAGI
jgi:hypothetical protein